MMIKDDPLQISHIGITNSQQQASLQIPPIPLDLGQGYSPQDLARLYHFPKNLGEGQTIGIIALGGHFSPRDLSLFCTRFNLPIPNIQMVGEEPKQFQSNLMADQETNLDIQMITGMVPNANIILYYGADFQESFQAVLDDTNNKIDVLFTCWAIGEKYLSRSEKQQLQTQIQALSLRGITLLAASGDEGIYQSQLNTRKPTKGINLPAGFAQVIACGGTTLHDNGLEEVWKEGRFISGGSFSNLTTAPAFQQPALANYASQHPDLTFSTLATPDISANASKIHSSVMIHHGETTKAWGTSVATPVLAGLIARLNSALGYNLGDCNPLFYQLMGTNAFNSNIPGNNGFPAASGWDPCTGLGSPHGENLLNAIRALKNLENT
jgi:kumamolisin